MKQYRDNGAVGALLDEYERAILELSSVLDIVQPDQLTKIVDPHTDDEDCRSIQTIMTHVVSAGYNYASTIINKYVREEKFKVKTSRATIVEYKNDLKSMFQFTETVFNNNPTLPIEESVTEHKMVTSWGQILIN